MSIQKKNICVAILVVKLNQLLVPEFRPPDWTFSYQEKYHSSGPDSFFLLRALPSRKASLNKPSLQGFLY